MANTIQILRSTTAAATPTLDAGELGVNLTDNTLYVGQDANTKLLIHSDNADGSTTFTDASPSEHTVTATNALHKTAQKKFGASSIYFDGTGDYLDVASSSDFQFGTGDFTLEAWVYLTAIGAYQNIFDTYSPSGSNGFLAEIWSDNTISFYSEGGVGWRTPGGTVMAINTWYHLAWVRDGNNLRMFVNGVQAGATQTLSSSDNYTGGALRIGGRSTAQWFNGYMDEIRISKGIARWTEAFTPPTRRYGVMSPEDHLPLSGGTITGALLAPSGSTNILNKRTKELFVFSCGPGTVGVGGNPKYVADEENRTATGSWASYGIQVQAVSKTAWVKVDCLTQYRVTSFAVSSYPGGSHKPGGNWWLEGSNDDSTWVTLGIGNYRQWKPYGYTGADYSGTYPFDQQQIVRCTSNFGDYRYFRINSNTFSDNGTNNYLLVMNWGLFVGGTQQDTYNRPIETAFGMTVGGSITPFVNNSYDLGNDSNRFKNLYLSDALTGTTGSFSGALTVSGNLGVGIAPIHTTMHLAKDAGANIRFVNTNSTQVDPGTHNFFTIGEGVGANNRFSFRGNSYRSTDTLTVDFENNRVGVALTNTSPTTTLDVNGAATFSGALTVGSYSSSNTTISGSGATIIRSSAANIGILQLSSQAATILSEVAITMDIRATTQAATIAGLALMALRICGLIHQVY